MVDGFKLKPIIDEPQSQVRDKVYQQLRRAIFDGALQPGERLIERKLAQIFGVSRTPVREAIRMLELAGLVYHLPRIGVVVTEINQSEVLEIYRIRAVLEGLAARMAAERISPDQLAQLEKLLRSIEESFKRKELDSLEKFHRQFNDLIYKAAGSARLYDMITTLLDYVVRYARVGYSKPGRIEEANKEHRRLLEALKLKDGDLAERLAREHIENSKKAYFSTLDKGQF
ncbi:GntR family transcriptional regulator [Peptococcaceae bacterium 1198_IL3148]